MMEYLKVITRPCSLFDVRAWYEGESKELEKWTGFGFFESFFLSSSNLVSVYYKKSELDEFDKVLDKVLDEAFFDRLCEDFFKIIEESTNVVTISDIYKLSVKAWPSLTIFDVISKYPEYATCGMLRRLIRIRNSTESFHYELSRKINHEDYPKDYIFYRGNVLRGSLYEFMKKNKIKISTIAL